MTVPEAPHRHRHDPGSGEGAVRILVGTDGSAPAERAVSWGAAMARNYGAELVLVRVLQPEQPGDAGGDGRGLAAQRVAERLTRQAEELMSGRGEGFAVVDDDPAAALVRAAGERGADVLVVGNAGMAGRKRFLLGNVPNRVSHLARCTVAIVNTVPQGMGHDAAPVVVTGGNGSLLTPRALHIARVLGHVGLSETLARHRPHGDAEEKRRARALRLALEELGPTFCKLGQVLSTRPDLLPPAYVAELAALQDRVPPMSESEVVAVMEAELQVPWEDVFDSIDPKPLASGTIAQVHRARLTGGERVVVKVQRPGARAAIERDLELFRRFSSAARARPAIRRVADAGALHDELSASLQRELDFRREADSMRRLREALRRHPRLGVPRLYDELCSGRLLVMEEIQGVPVREAPDGPARREAAAQLVASFYEQVLVHGLFHADPHPGNLLWWQDRLWLLDCGMVGEMPPDLRDALVLLLVAFWKEDAPFLADVALMLAGDDAPQDLDLAAFRNRIGAMTARYRGLPVSQLDLGAVLRDMSAVAVEHAVPLPAGLVLVGKALAQMQMTATALDADLDPLAHVGDLLTSTALRRAAAAISPHRLLYEAEKFRTRGMRVLESLERITGAQPGHPLQVQFRGTGTLEMRVRTAGRRIALSLIAVGFAIALAIAGTAANPPPAWLTGLIAALAAVFSLALLVALLAPEPQEGVRG